MALSIGGAYLWKDSDAAHVFRQLSQLSSIDLKACPLLGIETFQALASTQQRSVPLVELALEDMTLSTEAWQALATANSLGHLERLKLCRVAGLTDDIVTSLLSLAGQGRRNGGDDNNVDDDDNRVCCLQALDLSHNYDLTDATLDAIRLYTSASLRNLNISGLGQLSADALEALFTPVAVHNNKDDDDDATIAVVSSPPPRLKVLEMADMDHEAVTDNVLQAALVAAADVREDANATRYTTGGGMKRLNVQGAKALTDTTLEHLVTYSKMSLEELNVSYCTSLTDQGMGYLVEHCGIQLREIELWGLAQLTDTFLDGHRRTNDPTLVLTGIWMKKSSSRTIQ